MKKTNRTGFYFYGFLFVANFMTLLLCSQRLYEMGVSLASAVWMWAIFSSSMSSCVLLSMTCERLLELKRQYNYLYNFIFLCSVICAYICFGITNFQSQLSYVYPVIMLCACAGINGMFVMGVLFADEFGDEYLSSADHLPMAR